MNSKKKSMKSILVSFLIITSFALSAQNDKYQFHLNLNNISNDLIQIELTTPSINSDKIVYNIPKIVPGTYSLYEFGQYIMDFEAFDKDGVPLSVNRITKNRWEIDSATALSKISYWVEDTWDAEVEELVFEPGGTNIEEGENVILNNHGFFGYFDEMKELKYEVNVTRPENFYGTTGLATVSTKGNVDQFSTENYMDLVDSPIMYNVPDTLTFNVGGAEILISVYSKNKAATAEELGKEIKKILELQSDYLGGELPIDKYAFLIYLYEGQSGSGGSGALEHSYSSLYYLPEMSAEKLSGFLVSVAAHEFFHIVTPLNIHSEEIGDFDYINPKMSKHLWLYEGVTEYFAGHVQVYGRMQTQEEYLGVIKEKLSGAKRFKDDLSFTEMSLGCLDVHKSQYGNVYQKGALIGLCLDIVLRDNSDGKIGLKDMMDMLSKEYGKYNSFKDDELFDKIAELSAPEVNDFFNNYVEDSAPLPLKDLLNRVGITFKEDVKVKEITLGGIGLSYNPETKHLFVASVGEMNKFGKSMGYKLNDEIISVNGEVIDIEKAQEQIDSYKNSVEEGGKVTVVIARKHKGEFKNKTLKGKALKVGKHQDYLIEFNKDATEKQIQLRNSWLEKK